VKIKGNVKKGVQKQIHLNLHSAMYDQAMMLQQYG